MGNFKKRHDNGKPFPTDKNSNGSVHPNDAKSNGSHDHVDHAGAKSIKEKKMKKDEGITIETRMKGYDEKRIDWEYDRFLLNMSPYGSGDIAHAIRKAGEVDITGDDLADIIHEYGDDTDQDINVADFDINEILYDHILQNARNDIDNVLGYDLLNDFSGNGKEFYVAGNYMATVYDYSQEARDELEEKIRNASNDEIRKLGESKFVKSFLDDVEIELSNKGRRDEDDE